MVMSFTSLLAHDRDPGDVMCVTKRVTFDTISRCARANKFNAST